MQDSEASIEALARAEQWANPVAWNQALDRAFGNAVCDVRTDTGSSAMQGHTTVSEDPGTLTPFQVYGFRNEIESYYNKPEKSARVLRVLRRLNAKQIPDDVILDTKIDLSITRLYHHPRSEVRDTATALLTKWYKQTSCASGLGAFRRRQDGSIYDGPGGCISSQLLPASDRSFDKLGITNARECACCGDPIPKEATHSSNKTEGTTDVLETRSTASPGTVHGAQPLIDGSASAGDLSSSAALHNPSPRAVPDYSSILNLGLAFEQAFECVHAPGCPQGAMGPFGLATDSAKTIASTLKEYSSVERNECTADLKIMKRTTEEFLLEAQSYLGLCDSSMNMLASELGYFYSVTVESFHLAAATFATRTIGKTSLAVGRQRLRTIDAKIARLAAEKEANQLHPAAQGLLLKEKDSVEEELLKQERELELFASTNDPLETDFVMGALHPLRKMLDIIYQGGNKAYESEFKLFSGQFVVTQEKLIATQEQLQEARQVQDSMRTQLEDTRSEFAKFKKEVKNERLSLHSKYYKDVESRVEERVQQEKSKLADRLRNAEAKAQQCDSVVSQNLDLEMRVKETTHERDRYMSAKLDLEDRYKKLEEERDATQQGYEQVRQEKEGIEVRNATLEADLCSLRAELSRVTADLARYKDGANQRQDTKDKAPVTSGLQIVTHSEQVTESDRLETIAQKWRNDLQLAESGQNKHEHALKDTNAQIATALRQLDELKVPKVQQVPASRTKVAHTNRVPFNVAASAFPPRNGMNSPVALSASRPASRAMGMGEHTPPNNLHRLYGRPRPALLHTDAQAFPPLTRSAPAAGRASAPNWPVQNLRIKKS